MTPKRYKVVIDDAALDDLLDIYNYIRASAPDTAAEFIARLVADCHKLDLFPYGHQQRPPSKRVRKPLWQRPFENYRIIYTIFEQHRVVRVLGVQHGARNSWP